MNLTKRCIASFAVVWTIFAFSTAVHAQPPIDDHKLRDLPILQKWRRDFPMVHLNRLPEGQTDVGIGYIGKQAVVASIWKAFKPERARTGDGFQQDCVVYTRNIKFNNRLSIFNITLKGGTITIMAIKTQSALPLEDHAAMAMTAIPRKGIKYIQAGNEHIPVINDP
jgi:hypothetical protein